MINGDISNATPPRLIVIVDSVIESIEVDEDTTPMLKKLFAKAPSPAKKVKWNRAVLSHLWKVSDTYGLSVEMVGFEDEGWTQSDLNKLMYKLDARGGNPFNYAQVYDDFHELIGELPYLGNLKGVVDQPGRAARYGSWGLDLQNI
jgi:hypothetical protein